MALRREDVTARGEAVVLRFPLEVVRAERARERMLARRRRAASVAGAIAVTVVLVIEVARSPSPPASSSDAPDRITVRAGDTLWDVAERYAPAEVDPRAYVDAVAELNHLSGGVAAGQSLRLPE